jgi:hypothetical protein
MLHSLKQQAATVPETSLPALGRKIEEIIHMRGPLVSQVARSFAANELRTFNAKCDMVAADLDHVRDSISKVVRDVLNGMASTTNSNVSVATLLTAALNSLSAGEGASSYAELKSMLANLDRGLVKSSDSVEYEMHLNGLLKSLRDFRYIMDPDRKVHADDDKSALLRAEDASRWIGATGAQGTNVIMFQDTAPTAATDLDQFGAELSKCYIEGNSLNIAINEYLEEATVARTTGTPATDVLGWANRVANATLLTENTAGTAFRGFAGVHEGRKLAGFWVLDASAAGATSITAQNIFAVRRPSRS